MAKIQLDLEGGEGLQQIVEAFDDIIEKGDKVLQSAVETGNVMQKSAQQVVAAQAKASEAMRQNGVEIARTGALQKEVDAITVKQKNQATQATLNLLGQMAGLSNAEKNAFGDLVALVNQFDELNAKGKELQAMSDALKEQGKEGQSAAMSAEDQAKATEDIVAAQARLKELLEQNKAAAAALMPDLDKLVNGPAPAAITPAAPTSSGVDLSASINEAEVLTAKAFALKLALDNATDPEEIQRLNGELETTAERLEVLNKEVGPLLDTPEMDASIASVGQLNARIEQLKASLETATDPKEIERLNTDLERTQESLSAFGKVKPPDLSKTEESTSTIRTRLRETTEEAVRLFQNMHGEVTPEFVTQVNEAAKLKAEFQDVNEIIDALHPEAKLKVVAQIGESMIGAFTAVEGVFALLGEEKDDGLEKTKKNLEGLIALSVGANQFLGQFGTALKSLNAFVIANTTVTKANTGAQLENAAGAEIDAAAKVGSAGATGVLTGAVRGLTAAMAASPLVTAVIVLAAIGAAVALIGDDSEMTKEQVDELITSMDELAKLNEESQARLRRRFDLEDEIALLKEGNTEAGKRELIDKKLLNARRELQTNINDSVLQEVYLRTLADNLTDPEAKAAALSKLEDQIQNSKKLTEELRVTELNSQREVLQFEEDAARKRKAEAERRQKEAEAEAALRKRLAEEVAKFEDDLKKKAAQAQQTGAIAELEVQADEAAKAKQFDRELEFRKQILDIKAKASQEEVDQLQQALQRKIALQGVELSMGKDAFEKLTEIEKNALADRRIARGQADLDDEQLAQLQIIRDQKTADSDREVTKVVVKNATDRVAASKEEIHHALEVIDKREQIAEIQLDTASGNEAEMLRILQENGVKEVDSVRSVEEAKLKLQIASAEAKLKLLESQGTLSEEDQQAADLLRAQIDKLQAEVKDLKPIGIDWAKLLGITDEQFAKLQPIFQNALSSIGDALKNALFTDRIANIDAYIDKLHESMSETQRAIDREQKAKDEGLTNNLKSEQDHMKALQKMEQDAQKEKEKIAKQQAIIDAGKIALGAVLAIVNILTDSTLKGGVLGLAIAAAAIPAIFAIINATKKQGSEVAKFRTGTDYVELGKNEPGIDTVPAMLTEGEGVMRAEENRAMPNLMRGIHRKDLDTVSKGIREAIEYYNISLDDLVPERDEYGGIVNVRFAGVPIELLHAVSAEEVARNVPRVPNELPGEIRKVERENRAAELQQAMSQDLAPVMQRMAESNERLEALEKSRPTVAPLGEGRYRLIYHNGNTITVTVER